MRSIRATLMLLTLVLSGGTVLLESPADAVAATVPPCVGDCNGDGSVRVNELIRMVDILLGSVQASACPSPACNDGPLDISISCAVRAVNHSLNGCPAPAPTPAPSITYDLGTARLRRFAPPRLPVTQFLSGNFQAGIVPGEDGEQITLTEIDFHGGTLEPTVVTGSGVIDVPAGDLLTMTAMVSINGESVELNGEEPTSVLSGYPPTIDDITVCGAPDGPVTCDALEGGTASGYALSIVAAPEGTQTPGPTPTPTPVVLTRYRLVEGSSIALRAPTGGDPTPGPHALAGTFTVAPCSRVPNTYFAYVITGVDFDGGPQYVVSGADPEPVGALWGCPGVGVGYTDALTLVFPPEVYMGLDLLINGRAVGVGGFGPFDVGKQFGSHSTFESVRLCGNPDRPVTCRDLDGGSAAAYELVISAVPDE